MARKKTKNKSRKIYWIIISTVLLLVMYISWQLWQQHTTKFVHYPNFGIDMPVGYELHGIDVSKHQGSIWWPSVKAMKEKHIQISYVFIKATEGYTLTDKQFNKNWKLAHDVKITKGAYHFFVAGKDGKRQAEHFLDKVNFQKGDLPPVLDIEDLNGHSAESVRKELDEWLELVSDASGCIPIIYTNADFYNRYLSGFYDDNPLWVAHYYEQRKPDVDHPWVFWQHNDRGKVDGIKESVDFNVFSGGEAAFKKILIK